MVTESLEHDVNRTAGRLAGLVGRSHERLPGASGWTGWIVRAALPTALLLWLLAMREVRLDRMGALGLFQVLPALYWVAVVLLTIGFVLALRDGRLRRRWPAAYVLGLIMVIHATPSLIYPTLRYSWAWKHVAVVDAMIRHNGAVPHAGDLDIYNHWPGFFQLNALVLRATGLHSVLGYASWYPVLANLLLLGPLLLLYRTVTRDQRLVWGGIWLYYSTCWVGQDYFAPQTFAYLLFLLLLGLVLRRLSVARAAAGDAAGNGTQAAPAARAMSWVLDAPRRGGWRPGPFALLLVLIAGIVTSHPLTPLMLISVLTMLSLPRANRRVVLPVLAAAVALTFAWDNTVARPYIAKNLNSLIAGLSAGDQNVRPPGQLKLGVVDPGQVVVSYLAWATTGTVLLLAGIALVRHRWLRHTGLPLALFAPLPLLLGNSYGGEMILRSYLFMLPAAAFLAAAALLPGGRAGRVRGTVTVVTLLALLGGMYCGYYTKENMNRFTPQEVAAVKYLNSAAPVGSRIVSITGGLPGGHERYDQFDRVVMTLQPPDDQHRLLTDPLAELEAEMGNAVAAGPSYLILTREQIAECRLTGLLPADIVQRVTAAAAGSPAFQLVYSNDDAVIYRHVPTVSHTGGSGRSAHQ